MLPSKALFGADDLVRRDEAGDLVHATVVTFASPAARRRFTEALIADLLETNPDALEDAE